MTRPNGVTTSYSYDNLSRLLQALHQSGSKLIESTEYAYEAAGNRLSRTESTSAGGSKIEQHVSSYSYDAIYELTQVVLDGSVSETYSYPSADGRWATG